DYTVTTVCGPAVVSQPVTVNALPATPSPITGPTIICQGATVSLNSFTSGGVWTSSAPGVTIGSISGIATGVTVGTIAVITYTMSNSCGNAWFSRLDTVIANPPAISGTLNACVGATSNLSDGAGTWASSLPGT